MAFPVGAATLELEPSWDELAGWFPPDELELQPARARLSAVAAAITGAPILGLIVMASVLSVGRGSGPRVSDRGNSCNMQQMM